MSVTRNTLLSGVSRFAGVIAAVAVSVLTARYLGVHGKGVFMLSAVAVALLQVLGDVGFNASVTYVIGRGCLTREQALMFAVCASVGLGLVLWGVAALLWPLVSAGPMRGVPGAVWAAGMASLPGLYFCSLWVTTRMAFREFDAASRYLVISAGITLATAVGVLVVTGGGVLALVAANSVFFLAQALVLLVVTWRREGPPRRIPMETVRKMLSYGARWYPGSLMDLATLRLDTLILNVNSGASAVGAYSAAVTVGESLSQIDSAVGRATMPEVVSRERGAAAAVVAVTTRNILLVNGLLAVTLFVVAPWLVGFAFGPAFLSAVGPLRTLLPGALALSAARILLQYHRGQLGRPGVGSLVSLGSLTLSVLLYLTLIPRMGAMGAALGSSIAYIAAFVAALVLFIRSSGVPLRDIVVPRRADIEHYVALARGALVELRGGKP